ncbi:winged helix-turn-helix domain-containing protein [Lacimicrobium alkaliphilum]|nr:winged helix-turn-helix domain-containing protein [Lacimicrobium alkaliphilum]
MGKGKTPGGQFTIGEFRIDTGNNSIYHKQQTLHVEPRAMHVLLVLVEHAGQTVEREVLFDRVWGQQVVVEEALTRTISQLRKALNDNQSRKLIQTIPKKGYRLASDIKWHDGTGSSVRDTGVAMNADVSSPAPRKKPRTFSLKHLVWILPAVFFVLWLAFELSWLHQPATEYAESVIVKPDVGVLPLTNQSGNPQYDYLANGIADEVLTALTKTSDLDLTSRYSSFSYGNTELSAQKVAQELAVRYLLVGNLQQLNEQGYVIQVELVDARRKTAAWNRTYTGPQDQLSDVSRQISQDVHHYLLPDKAAAENAKWAPERIEVQAYQHYLQGRYWWMNGSTSEWFYRAEKAFLDAINVEPDFAAAHGSLAYIYARYHFHDIYMDKNEAIRKAGYAIEQALALDPDQVDALHARAILATLEQRFDDATKALERALEVRSPNAQAWYLLSELAVAQSQPDKALEYALRARQADPLSPWVNINLAIVYYYSGQSEQALQAISVAQSVDQDYSWSYVWQARILHKVGRLADAILAMQQCLSLDPGSAANSAYLGLLYLELDLQAEAASWFERTASLYGDSVDARFWKNFIRLGYQNKEPQISLSMLQSMQSIRTGTYDLVPLLRQNYLALEKQHQGARELAKVQPSPLKPDVTVNIHNSELSLALLALSDNSRIKNTLSHQLAYLEQQWPDWALHSGVRANHLFIQGKTEEMLTLLLQAYKKGWVPLWWLFIHSDKSDNARALKRLPEFSRLSRLIESEQQQQRQQLNTGNTKITE